MSEITLPLDLTGQADTNRVTGEIHTVSDSQGRTVTTNYGTFYTASMVITDISQGGALLKPGVDYTLLHLHTSASKESGQEVCTVIQFEDHISGDQSLTYQAVGGEYAGNPEAIRDLIDAIDLDQRAVVWGEILQKPDQFEPAKHLHHLGDLFGWEGVIALMEEIRKAILQGNKPVLDAMYHYMDHRFGLKQNQIDQLFELMGDVPKLFDQSFEITVGTNGDFGSINEALKEAGKYVPSYTVDRHVGYWTGPTITIKLLSGFVIAEQVYINRSDFSYVYIVSQDNTVTIQRSALTEQYTHYFGNVTGPQGHEVWPCFLIQNRAVSPILNIKMRMDESGPNKWATAIIVRSNATLLSYNLTVDNCSGTGVQVTGGYYFGYNDSTFFNNQGDSGFICEGGAQGVIYGRLTANDNSEQGTRVMEGSCLTVFNDVTCHNNGRNGLVVAGEFNTEKSIYAGENGDDGVDVEGGVLYCKGGDFHVHDNGRHGLEVDVGGNFSFKGLSFDALRNQQNNINVAQGSTVVTKNSDINAKRANWKGISCMHGSVIYCGGRLTLDNNGSHGVDVVGSGKVSANKIASDSNGGDGIRLRNHSTVVSTNAIQSRDNGRWGIHAVGGCGVGSEVLINAHGHNGWGIHVDGYSFVTAPDISANTNISQGNIGAAGGINAHN